MCDVIRFSFILVAVALVQATSALGQPEAGPTASVPPEAAAAGKDVVQALNSAFTKVFEVVAPSVVIIEVTKKNDGSEGPSLDDLFFQSPDDNNPPRRGPRSLQPSHSETAPRSSQNASTKPRSCT